MPDSPEPQGATGRAVRPRHLLQMAVGLILLAAVLWVAGPARVVELLRATDLLWYAAAAGVYAVVAAARGLRLALLAPIGVLEACQLGMAVQAAVQVIPARLGELSLPVLLRRASGLPLSAGAGILLAVRALDMAALGAWAGTAIGIHWGLERPIILAASAILVLPLVFLPLLASLGDRLATRFLAPRGLAGRRWTRRIRRTRGTLELLRRQPLRLLSALALSLAGWGFLWISVWCLLRAIGHSMALDAVVLGAASASVATLLPVNVFASFGTMETGWTAAFAALGVSVTTAAATGLAVHILSLMVTVLYGAVAFVTMPALRRRR